MRITLVGKLWNLIFKSLPKRPQKVYGLCDEPSKKGKQITIATGLTEIDELDTLIHEMIHASVWQLDEEIVDRMSTDIARVLFRLGYRRNKGE